MAGSLKKWGGEVLTSGDFNGIHNFILNRLLEYGYDGADITTHSNIIIDKFTSDSLATTTNLRYNSTGDYYEFIKVDDEIDDSDYTANWTASTSGSGTGSHTETVVENASKLSCTTSTNTFATATASATSDGTTPIDFYNSNADVYIKCRIVYATDASNSGSDSAIAQFGLTDGSNTVWLKTSSTPGSTSSDDSVWEIFIDASADTCELYNDGVLETSGIDISSLTGGNYYFIIKASCDDGASGSGSSANIDLYYLYSMGVGYSNGVGVTSSTSASSTVDTMITRQFSSNLEDTTFSGESSSDGGSNYTSHSDGELVSIANTGSSVKHRFTFSAPSSITVGGNKEFGRFTGYASYFENE